jgi:glyoxylase-like metal-dependent hydrolase (beta-lactamase superfamily II)
MTIEVKKWTLGSVMTNAYVLGDTESGQAVVIDPVDNAPLLKQTADNNGWTIKLILATHGHFDHISASQELQQLTGAPFLAHQGDKFLLDMLPEQSRRFLNVDALLPEAATPERWLVEGEMLEVGAIKLDVLFTPGHSPGHVSFFLRDQRMVFSGDCLFAGNVGHVRTPGANYDLLMTSIFATLLPLGDDVQVMAGHGRHTTLGHERTTNPYLLEYSQR